MTSRSMGREAWTQYWRCYRLAHPDKDRVLHSALDPFGSQSRRRASAALFLNLAAHWRRNNQRWPRLHPWLDWARSEVEAARSFRL